MNQLLCTWLVREPEELIGLRFTDLLPVGQRLFYANHQALVETIAGGAQELSYDLRRGDRSLLPVFVTTERLEGGRQVYCIYRAENRRRYEQQLLEAKKVAERAAQTRSEFVRTVTHELRTPVHAIASMAELLEAEPLSGGQVALVRQLGKSTQQLSDLINDLLDLSKAESGKLVINAAPTCVADLCDELVYALRPQAARKLLTVDTAYAALSGSWFALDAGKLRQVLTNLLGNAIKFTDEGSVRLSAAVDTDVAAEPRGRPRLTFAVEDTGVGIAPEDVERVFEVFEQSGRGQTRSDSSGLGLSISRHLVALLGGELSVESRLGSGTVFYFSIPADGAVPPTPVADTADPQATSPEGRRLDGLRVLHVDDDETNRFIARRHLETWGTDYAEASDGRSAIALASANAYDVVLLDLRMPDVNGVEVAARIRAMTHQRDTALYALSATEVDEDTATSMLFAGSLTKPYSGAALHALLVPHHAFRQNPTTVGDERADRELTTLHEPREASGQGATIDFGSIRAEFADDPEALTHLLTIMADNLEASRDATVAAVAAGEIGAIDEYKHRYGTTLRLLAPQPLVDLLAEAEVAHEVGARGALANELRAAIDATVALMRARRS